MIKFGKMVKSLFSKLQRILSKWNLFCFGQIVFNFARTFAAHHKKKLCSCVFFKSLLLTYLITLSLEKESIVLVKSLIRNVC